MTIENINATKQTYLRYLARPLLSYSDAAALLNGYDPKILIINTSLETLAEAYKSAKENSSFDARVDSDDREYAFKKIYDLRDDIEAQFSHASASGNYVRPEDLITWAFTIELELSEDLRGTSSELFGGSQKNGADQTLLQEQIEALTKENARLLDALSKFQKSEIKPKERKSLYTILLGVALEQYNWDPKSGASKVFEHIAKDLEEHGLSLKSQTIRKHLRKAYHKLLG